MATPAYSSHHISDKASQFTESVIREMTREAMKYGAVNLSQGFPDFAAPEDIKQVAMQAIADDINQYAVTWGAKDFREAIARKTRWYLGLDIDPETEITVTCGATEGMIGFQAHWSAQYLPTPGGFNMPGAWRPGAAHRFRNIRIKDLTE